MTITFETKSSLIDFINRFEGTGYFVYETAYTKLLKYSEFCNLFEVSDCTLFPLSLEFKKDMVQLCGIVVEREGKKDVIFTSFDELKETADRLGGKEVVKTFSLDDRYDGHRRYREILNDALSDKVLDYLKKDILLGNKY